MEIQTTSKSRSWLMLLGVLLCSCDDDGSPRQAPDPGRSGSSRLLALTGEIFVLGSREAVPASDETPGWTRFAHDVWMDTTEMTQAEFSALLRRNPSTTKGDRIPVTNVSWYDAVLAANARSRRDGLDTLYEYIAVRADSAGNAGNLTGLTVHLDRSGWRLPTEAEWEAAARAGTGTPWTWGTLADSSRADAFAWFRDNASGRIHEVATKSPNAWGLYDMAGNAMEWVNDWKGPFPRDTIEDFAGQDVPADVPDVPLKGGAFLYGLANLRPSMRSATYPAYRSSRAEYVGFRLARGAFSPRYRSSTGVEVFTPPVTLVRTDVARLMGAWEARLVFVNRYQGRGTLMWIDYGETNPVARGLLDSLPVFHPSISPDGRWVAWSTGLEGSTGPSRVRARRLARNDTAVLDLGAGAIPRWWVDGADTFLVRASALDNTSPDWTATKTTARRWSNGGLAGSEETWSSSGSYHDGRSGPYLYTGYRRLRQRDSRTGKDRILFTGPANGKGAGDTSQVCNVSASPDGSGRALFLDFGFGSVSTVVGRPYGIHEVGFVSDSAGRIVRQIPAPIGERQWEHLEWSNSSRWAVSCSIDAAGGYRNLYLVDIDSTKTKRILSGEDLWQPALWTSDPEGEEGALAVDSIGQYFVPSTGPELAAIGANLLRFWLERDSLEVAMVGSSQINGFSRAHFPSHKVSTLAWPAAVHSDYDSLVRKYVVPHARNLRIVVVTLMPGWFFPHDAGWPSSRWEGGFGNSLGSRYDVSNGYWTSGTPAGFDRMVRRRMQMEGIEESLPLYAGPGSGWGGLSPEIHPATSEDTTQELYRGTMSRMESLLGFLTSRGVHVVLLHSPESPAYRTSPQAGLWGPSWPALRAILDRARTWERSNRRVHLYDANMDGNHDYQFTEFSNENHLSFDGARKLGLRLDSLFSTITSTGSVPSTE